MDITPKEIKKIGDRILGIEWSDGRKDEFDVVRLRLECPCALCVDEWTGERKLTPESVSDAIRPVKITSVGRYALNIRFSDRHDTGIYPFKLLRELAARR